LTPLRFATTLAARLRRFSPPLIILLAFRRLWLRLPLFHFSPYFRHRHYFH
jgi:hypothetical protein